MGMGMETYTFTPHHEPAESPHNRRRAQARAHLGLCAASPELAIIPEQAKPSRSSLKPGNLQSITRVSRFPLERASLVLMEYDRYEISVASGERWLGSKFRLARGDEVVEDLQTLTGARPQASLASLGGAGAG